MFFFNIIDFYFLKFLMFYIVFMLYYHKFICVTQNYHRMNFINLFNIA